MQLSDIALKRERDQTSHSLGVTLTNPYPVRVRGAVRVSLISPETLLGVLEADLAPGAHQSFVLSVPLSQLSLEQLELTALVFSVGPELTVQARILSVRGQSLNARLTPVLDVPFMGSLLVMQGNLVVAHLRRRAPDAPLPCNLRLPTTIVDRSRELRLRFASDVGLAEQLMAATE